MRLINDHKVCMPYINKIQTPIGLSSPPDSKVHVVNMSPTWVLSAPDGPHADPMNFAIWAAAECMGLLTGPWLTSSKPVNEITHRALI